MNNIKKYTTFLLLTNKIEINKIKKYTTFLFIPNEIKINKIKKYLSFLFLLIYLLFFLSLEKCFDGWDQCCIKTEWIKLKLREALLSIIITLILFELMIFNILSKYNLIHFAIVFFIFYIFSHGKNFNDHGFYNILGYFLILIILLILLLPFNFLFKITKNKKIILIYLLTIFIICDITFITYIRKYMDCNDWKMGLNNTSLENSIKKYGCQIIAPKICPFKIGKKITDLTKIKNIKCENLIKRSKEKILQLSKSPYIDKPTKRIGYPLTNKDPICFLDYNDEISNFIQEYFLNNLIDMDKINLYNYSSKNIPEIEIDYSNNSEGIMKINLIFNESLSKERKRKEKFSKPYSENIIVLYIDSVSRANSLRQLKKTLNFFEKFMSFRGNFHKNHPSEKFHSFQFFKYHSFKYYTNGNFPILYYGNQRDKKMNSLITKYLKENGFITCYANDYCFKDNIRTFHNLSFSEAYDHQFIICDPNADHYNQNFIRCLYGKTNAEHLYEYGKQFWRKYKNNRKFLNIIINDGHEGTLEVVRYADNTIYHFLNNLFEDNLLKDTSVFFLSDHGVGMPSIYYFTKFYHIEEQLPMFYLLINDRKNIGYNKQYLNINKNQQTFITAYDIYSTLIHIIYGDKYYILKKNVNNNNFNLSIFGESLFGCIDSKSRNPKLYENMVDFVCK